jgi:hypothetical protein
MFKTLKFLMFKTPVTNKKASHHLSPIVFSFLLKIGVGEEKRGCLKMEK